jgi:hypothetical protein
MWTKLNGGSIRDPERRLWLLLLSEATSPGEKNWLRI